MPYGTDSFTDRYGDFKQPTVIDYDQSTNKVLMESSLLFAEESIQQYKKDVEDVLKEVLEINPFFAGHRYMSFTFSNNGKLAWDLKKIEEMKSNSDWLYAFRRYLNKVKTKHFLNKKP